MSPASVSCLLPLVVFPFPLPHFLGAVSGKGNNCACFTQTLQYSHRGINRLPPPACICWALESRVLPMGRVKLSKVFPVVLAEEGGLRGPTQDAGGECAEQSDIRLCKFKS